VLVGPGVYRSGSAVAPGGTLANRVCITNAILVRGVNGPAVTRITGASDGGAYGPAAVRCAYIGGGGELRGYNDLRIDRISPTQTLTDMPLPFVPSAGETYRIQIVRRRGWIGVSIDGHAIGSVYDSYFTGGRVGMTTYTTQTLFDDFTVRTLAAVDPDPDPGCTDTFEDGTADGWYAGYGTWAVTAASPIAGTYSYRQSNAGYDRARSEHEKVYDGDITVETDVRLLGGSGEEIMLDLYTRRIERRPGDLQVRMGLGL
jgi:hypothetical protein